MLPASLPSSAVFHSSFFDVPCRRVSTMTQQTSTQLNKITAGTIRTSCHHQVQQCLPQVARSNSNSSSGRYATSRSSRGKVAAFHEMSSVRRSQSIGVGLCRRVIGVAVAMKWSWLIHLHALMKTGIGTTGCHWTHMEWICGGKCELHILFVRQFLSFLLSLLYPLHDTTYWT